MRKLLVLILVVFTFVCFNQVHAVGETNVVVKEETLLGADFSTSRYNYVLSKSFEESPNTIEAWIRLGELYGEAGGIIFSNYEYDSKNSVSLMVDNNRNVSLLWNSGQVTITFDEYEIRVDEWEHVTFIRDEDNSCFKLYINGNIVQTIDAYVGTDAICNYKFIVGGDWANYSATKNPFRGEIGQVTVYSKAISSRLVYDDYINHKSISSENREDLLFNGEFTFGCEVAVDTSVNNNHAIIRSNDYFYKGDVYAAKDYTFAVIPDPQLMARWAQSNLTSISDYLIDYHTKNNNKLAMMLCVGDNADGYSSTYPELTMDFQLAAVKNVYNTLYNAGIRWATTPGNHDYDDNCSSTRNLTYYNKYFSHEEIKTYDYFGGVFKEGQTQNAYYLFEAAGVPYLVMSIEFGASDDVLDWANTIVSANPTRRVIVFTHAFVGPDGEIIDRTMPHSPTSYGTWAKNNGANSPAEIYDKFIKKHENMFMVFSGHVPTDNIIRKETVGDHGNKISSYLIDAQGVMASGCYSILSLLTFDELNQTVGINYVSTTDEKLYNIQNQFEFSFKGHTNILSSIYYNADGTLKDAYKGGQN